MVTIKDIAKAANVSQATVSRVINNGPKVGPAKRAHVQRIMDELGYRPNLAARAFVTNKFTSLGVLVPEILDPFMATFAHHIEKLCQSMGLQTFITSGHNDVTKEKLAIEHLLDHRVSAMVLHSKVISDEDLLKYSELCPGLVLINRLVPGLEERCVWLDNRMGSELVVEYLFSMGHREFAYINSDFEIDDPQLRLKGVKSCLTRHNVKLPNSAIAYAPPFHEGGAQAVESLMARGTKFTALVTYNDAMAVGAMNFMLDQGMHIPRDVSVVGFDDVVYARDARPQLTTMRYPISMMAQAAASIAIQSAQQQTIDPTIQRKYTPSLIRRQSVIGRM